MKNAYVLVDHHGDDGTVRAGAVLHDLSDHRFSALQKRGLVREVNASDLKATPEHKNKAAPAHPNKSADGKKPN